MFTGCQIIGQYLWPGMFWNTILRMRFQHPAVLGNTLLFWVKFASDQHNPKPYQTQTCNFSSTWRFQKILVALSEETSKKKKIDNFRSSFPTKLPHVSIFKKGKTMSSLWKYLWTSTLFKTPISVEICFVLWRQLPTTSSSKSTWTIAQLNSRTKHSKVHRLCPASFGRRYLWKPTLNMW